MLTYQVRRRVFRVERLADLAFPAACVIRWHLGPGQVFGTSASGGRTAVRAVAATTWFNANTGQHTIESAEPLKPLDVTIEAPDGVVRLNGNVFEIRRSFPSLDAVGDYVLGVYYGLPALLNVPFADPPLVARVEGDIGGVPFRWELADWHVPFRVTSQEHQEQAFVSAWQRMALLGLRRRRLHAALHYFHVAVRLDRCAANPGEFMAEQVLNLCKVLEAMFPPGGDGKTRDAARAGLRQLGYSDREIERNFLPVMALRNAIDVGHVFLALLKRRHLSAIHTFTERAETAFRGLLERALTAVADGRWDIANFDGVKPSSEVLDIIERLEKAWGEEGPTPTPSP